MKKYELVEVRTQIIGGNILTHELRTGVVRELSDDPNILEVYKVFGDDMNVPFYAIYIHKHPTYIDVVSKHDNEIPLFYLDEVKDE